MMKRIVYFIIACSLLVACKEEGRLDIIDDAAPAPAPITVKEVKGRPGGAVIWYKVPKDDNLLGVKAVYTRNGEQVEAKASVYVDSLIVEGFGNVTSQEIVLYAIGKNQKLSTPVRTTIAPLAPPVQSVTFDVEAGFGGAMVSLSENRSNADLAIILMADTLGNSRYVDLQTFYTKSAMIKLPRRGLKSKPMNFGVYLRDRWGNRSDTIYRTLTPIEEVKIPKDRFRNAALPTDFYAPVENRTGFRLEMIWNGKEYPAGEPYASTSNAPMPQWFTIDLGTKVKISRFQKWPRANYELYSGAAPRVFEIWGSEHPNPDGSWDDSWFLLGEFEQFKPSGYGEGRDVGPITDEDTDYWYNRTEFDLVPTDKVPDPYRPVTHLRMKILSTYNTYGTEATNGQLIIGEMTFWGQIIN